MNERIRLLARQCEYIKQGNVIHDMDQFAKLIAKDCIDIMNEQSYNTSNLLTCPPKSAAIWDAKNAISKRYGIE